MPSLALALVLVQTQTAPVHLERRFVVGERKAYVVSSSLKLETSARGLDTWMPGEVSLRYAFDTEVRKIGADGIAQVRYRRPALTVTEDTGQEGGPERKVERLAWDQILTLSPVNKLLGSTPTPKATKPRRSIRFLSPLALAQRGSGDSFVGEIYRLALFAGRVESSLDLAPPLPLNDVAVGDTWKQTVSYQPQRTRAGSQAVQRLDVTYTYRGALTRNGRTVQRIDGDLLLDTDLAALGNEAAGKSSEESGLAKLPLRLQSHVEFELDPKSLATLSARANSKGGFSIYGKDDPETALLAQRFVGTTTLAPTAWPAK